MVEHVRLVREEVLLKSAAPAVKGILMTLTDPYSITHDTWLRVQQQYPALLSHVVIPKNHDLQKALAVLASQTRCQTRHTRISKQTYSPEGQSSRRKGQKNTYTTELTPKALTIIQAIQQQHCLKTGKVLPLWKIISQALEKYGKKDALGQLRLCFSLRSVILVPMPAPATH